MIDTLLLTYTEAAHRLGLRSGRSVRRLVAQGKLTPVYPLPRSPRIPLQDLHRAIALCELRGCWKIPWRAS